MMPFSIDAVVVDVLGTLVDEPAGLRAAIGTAAPDRDDAEIEELLDLWQHHVEREQRRIVGEQRPYVATDVLDAEAASLVADRAHITDSDRVSALAGATRRLSPWPDSHSGLARLAERYPLIGLSNASPAALLRLNAHARLRWHQVLSAESASTYKPAPAVYRLAVDVVARPPERLLMVAAHAWDLRGAQKIGLRTAHVARPVGEPPVATDRFDLYAQSLDDLADQLEADEAGAASCVGHNVRKR